jgi:hypothetical protein
LINFAWHIDLNAIFVTDMNHSSENRAHFLNRIILIIAVGFLFFLKSEKMADNQHNGCRKITIIEFKVKPEAIPVIASDIPPIGWFPFTIKKTKPAPAPAPKVALNQAVTLEIRICKFTYFNAKPLIQNSVNYRCLARYPDDEYPSLS